MKHGYRPLVALLLQWLVILSGCAGFSGLARADAQVNAGADSPAAANHIAAQLLAEGPATPGQPVMLAIAMRPEQGWHGYWSNPGDAGFGMTLTWRLPAGASAGTPQYPVPQTLLIAGLMNHVYEDAYAVLIPLTLPPGTRPDAALPIRVEASWLACTDQVCVPERAELTTRLLVRGPATTASADPRFDNWRARLPAPLGMPAHFAIDGNVLRIGVPLPRGVALESPHLFAGEERVLNYAAPQEFRRQGDLLVITVARAAGATAPDPTQLTGAQFTGVLRLNAAGDGLAFTARPGPVAAGGEPVISTAPAAARSSAGSFAALVLAALAGGLLLNIMPCVFPILSLKAISLARAGESEAEARQEGLAYTAGVVLACATLGALLLALRAGGSEIGWAFQLQEPGVVVALLLLAAAITANLAGVYEVMVPGFVSGRSGSGSGPRSGRNAFATGLLAAFVATPCTGPFMAAAMGAALVLPPVQGMALFVALGLGLALPFLAIAFIPPLRRALPRPGAWMTRFRQIMAVPMALTAAALAWLAWRLGGTTFLLLGIMAALGVLVLLGAMGRTQRAGRSARTPALAAAALASVAVVGLPGLASPPALAAADGIVPYQPFTEAALAKALRSGKPVFVWLTADWCLTCKVNERVAIEQETTRAAFARAGVIVLRGDWTRRDPAITRYLTAQGAAGVPLYVWYKADGSRETLPQLLTPDSLAALAAAR